MKKVAICIVDDDPNELERFKNALKERFDIGGGASPEQALRDLRQQTDRNPALYLLDLYEPGGPISGTTRQRLHEARKKFLNAEAEFYGVLGALEQTKDKSFENARRLSGRVFKRPFAFFTRKGNIQDVIAVQETFGVVPFIRKPEPEPKTIRDEDDLEQVYDDALKEEIDLLEARILKAIRQCSWWSQYGEFIVVAVILALALGVCSSLIANLLWPLFGMTSLWSWIIVTVALTYFLLRCSQRRW